MSSRPKNRIRTYRRRSGFGQHDVAFLLGSKGRATVCRYEQGHRIPSLRAALTLAAILDVSADVLFADMHKQVRQDIALRIATLRSEIEHRNGKGRTSALVSRQLRWLDDHHGRIQMEEYQSQ